MCGDHRDSDAAKRKYVTQDKYHDTSPNRLSSALGHPRNLEALQLRLSEVETLHWLGAKPDATEQRFGGAPGP